MKEERIVNVTELLSVLNDIDRPRWCEVQFRTTPTMNKTDNEFYGHVEKVTTGRYFIGFSYENRVNNNMEKENLEREFTSQSSSGMFHVSKCVLCDNKTKTKFYVNLEYHMRKPNGKRVPEPKFEIYYDGEQVRNQRLKRSIMSKFRIRIVDIKSQPQENKVTIIKPNIENIIYITLNGIRYKVKKEV